MTSLEMITKLQREDLKGVGVRATYKDGSVIYYFYEDFIEDKGIDRASRDFVNNNKIKRHEYFYEFYDFEKIINIGIDGDFLAIGSDGKEYEAIYNAELKEMFFTIPYNVQVLGYLKTFMERKSMYRR